MSHILFIQRGVARVCAFHATTNYEVERYNTADARGTAAMAEVSHQRLTQKKH